MTRSGLCREAWDPSEGLGCSGCCISALHQCLEQRNLIPKKPSVPSCWSPALSPWQREQIAALHWGVKCGFQSWEG